MPYPSPFQPPILDAVPKPQTVRERLGQVLREANLLRAMLRLSERVEREREQKGEEVRHAG
jgi:hypothetical protein